MLKEKGLKQSSDSGELESICQEAIASSEKAVAEFRAGQEKAINAIKGKVMKATKGKANPKMVDEIIRKLITE